MTGITDIAAVNVQTGFAGSGNAIVARGAGAENMHMVNRCRDYRQPTGRKSFMTGTANGGAVNVRRTLATGRYPVMTGIAIVGKATVIHHRHRHPGRIAVATVAFQNRRYMQRTLAAGDYPVVATAAKANHLRVINGRGRHRNPRNRSGQMTGIAERGGIDMSRALAAGRDAVVTGQTAAIHLTVIHRAGSQRCPGRGRNVMTGITNIRGIYVSDMFSTGNYAVVTSGAIATETRVINTADRHPRRHAVANIAGVTG